MLPFKIFIYGQIKVKKISKENKKYLLAFLFFIYELIIILTNTAILIEIW